MKNFVAFVTVGTLSAHALAQPGTISQIDIRARVKGTTEWLNVVNVAPADAFAPVDVEVGVFYFRNSGYGFSTCVHNLVTSNWLSGDVLTLVDRPDSAVHPDGRQGRFNFGGQAQAGYTTGVDAGRLRISAPNNPNDVIGGGIQLKQNTPVASGTFFNPADGVLGYRFDIKLNNPTPGLFNSRTLLCDAPLTRVNSYSVYDTVASTISTSIKSSLLATDTATINVVWACAGSITIDQQPMDQSVSGGTATFSVLATGSSISYQWRKDATPLIDGGRIAGATTPSLSIADVEPGDLGSYDCVLSNGCSPVTSNSASLTCITPSITQQPADQPIHPGQTAMFSVVASGSNLAFQWMKGGVMLADGGRISGAHLPTLSITNVQTSDQTNYECVVFNSCSGVTSTAAQLTCSPVITQQPPTTITLRTGTVLSVGVPVGSVQSFRWRRDGQNLFNVPGLFSGVTTKTLMFLSNDPSIPGGFDCVLTNSCGSVTTTTTTVFCPSDFNADGFVTGEDYDEYREAFVAGDVSSDFDGDSFVTGDDFDAYLLAFIEGC